MSDSMISPFKGKPVSSNLLEFNEIEEDKHIQAIQQQFYNKFLQDNRLLSCKIVGSVKIEGTVFKRSYAIYEIEVITQDLHYLINKRYSEFRVLWESNKTSCFESDQQNFPPKTYLRSSVQENIISQRKQNLNKFLNNFVEKNNCDSQAKIRFYKFLQVWENYCQKGFNEQVIRESTNTTQQTITLQIMKLNGISKNVHKIFKVLEEMILDKKNRLSAQNIRSLLFGFGDKKGITQFVLSHDNQIIIIEGLKFLLMLMDQQQNRQAQSYRKVFSTCTTQTLILNQSKQVQLLGNSVIKNLYFQLLEIYLQKKQKLNWKLLFEQQHQSMLKNFLFWQRSQKLFNDTITQAERSNSQNKKKINKGSAFRTATSSNGLRKSIISQSSSSKQRKESTINLIDTLLKELEAFDEMQLFNYQTIYREELKYNQLIEMRISDNNQVIKITIKSAYPMQQLKEAIMSGGKQWNLNFSKTQQLNQSAQTYCRTICFKKNKTKKYKFQLDVSQENNIYQIVKYPIHSASGDFCLLQTITLRENQGTQKGTQIELNFGMCHKNVSDYFSEQFSGQECNLPLLIKQTLIK